MHLSFVKLRTTFSTLSDLQVTLNLSQHLIIRWYHSHNDLVLAWWISRMLCCIGSICMAFEASSSLLALNTIWHGLGHQWGLSVLYLLYLVLYDTEVTSTLNPIRFCDTLGDFTHWEALGGRVFIFCVTDIWWHWLFYGWSQLMRSKGPILLINCPVSGLLCFLWHCFDQGYNIIEWANTNHAITQCASPVVIKYVVCSLSHVICMYFTKFTQFTEWSQHKSWSRFRYLILPYILWHWSH